MGWLGDSSHRRQGCQATKLKYNSKGNNKAEEHMVLVVVHGYKQEVHVCKVNTDVTCERDMW